MRLDTAVLVVAGLTVLACAPRRIPGTEIRDTPDTRAVVSAIDAYRQAAEKRDRGKVNFARPRQIDHSNAQREGAHGNDEHQRREQCDEKSQQVCGHATSFIRWAESGRTADAGASGDLAGWGPAPK